jgi:ABC-type polysaccharide/polyol phosphate export permease
MKTIFLGTYYQVLIFLRVKKAVFFTFFFPCFIYVIFSLISGIDNEDYQRFILTGIIILTTASDALFSIGSTIIDYYKSGLIKFFKVAPYSFIKDVCYMIISRIIIVLASSAIIFVIAYFMSSIKFSLREVVYVISGIFAGLFIFGLLGLIIAGISKEHSANNAILNTVFYIAIFLSNTFYPLTEINPAFETVVMFNPMTPVLGLTRGTPDIFPLMAWITILIFIQSVFFVKSRIKR